MLFKYQNNVKSYQKDIACKIAFRYYTPIKTRYTKTRNLKMTNLQNFKKQLNSVAPIECDLKVGDRVIYKNDFGSKFGPFEVIGFEKKEDISGGRFVYLNKDSYWFPVKAEQLTKQ